MKKTNTYKVVISELLEKEVEVQAINEDEAIENARSQYKNEKIVLDSSNYVHTNFVVSGWNEIQKHGCWRCKGDSVLHFSKTDGQEVLEKETCEKCGDLR